MLALTDGSDMITCIAEQYRLDVVHGGSSDLCRFQWQHIKVAQVTVSSSHTAAFLYRYKCSICIKMDTRCIYY